MDNVLPSLCQFKLLKINWLIILFLVELWFELKFYSLMGL